MIVVHFGLHFLIQMRREALIQYVVTKPSNNNSLISIKGEKQ